MDDSFSSVVTATNANLTRLSSTVSTTAQALATKSYGELLGNASYQRTMQEIAKPLFQRRFFSSTRTRPTEVVRRSSSTELAAFRVLSTIPDDLLGDLPEPSFKYSLFQGFQAGHASAGQENTSQEYALETCEVRKELAASEIQELDARIAKLKQMRKVVFDKVADLEKEERRVERSFPPEDAKKAVGEADTNGQSAKSGTVPAKGSQRRRSRRKTRPTLQSFYTAGEQIRTLSTGAKPVASMDFDCPFGSLVAATGADIQVWDLSGDRLGTLSSHSASVSCLLLDDFVCASGALDATLKLWDISRQEELGTYSGHVEAISTLCLDHDALVSGSNDKTIRQWDVETQKCIQTLDVLSESTVSPSWALSQKPLKLAQLLAPLAWPVAELAPSVGALQNFYSALAAGTADGAVRLWDLRTGTVHRTLTGHTAPISCVQFDENYLVSGALDNSIRVWDLRTGRILDMWGYESPVLSLHFDAKRVVAATGEPCVHIYERETTKRYSVGSEEQTAGVTAVRQQNGYLVDSRLDGSINVWAV